MGERKNTSRETGTLVETAACSVLGEMGYEIVERNYTCRFGEIDIVAFEGGTLAFVEVRYRGRTSRLTSGESLTRLKAARLKRAIRDYLFRRSIGDRVPVRIDACLAYPAPYGERCSRVEPVRDIPGLGTVVFEVIRGVFETA